jgi:hypothetical protein
MVANREDYLRVKSIADPLPGNPPHGSSTVMIFVEDFEFCRLVCSLYSPMKGYVVYAGDAR